MTNAGVDAVMQREWRRYSAGERLARFMVYAAIVAAVVLSIRTVEVIPDFILDAPEQVVDLLKRMWPPDVASYPQEIHAALLDSLHIATVGTVLGRRHGAAVRISRRAQCHTMAVA